MSDYLPPTDETFANPMAQNAPVEQRFKTVEEPAPGGERENLITEGPGGVTAEDIKEAMRDVIDPELGVNIVDLGLLYDMRFTASGGVILEMTLTSAACPLTDMIEQQVRLILEGMVTEVSFQWVWMPPWGPDRITDEGREQLRALGFNV